MPVSLDQIKSATSDELLVMVERRHPDYKDSYKHWEFLELSYQGGREWIEKNLFTYHKEGMREYRERKKRAYRFPHAREVVSLVNKYVFKGDIERSESVPPVVQDFWHAATPLKRPINDLMETISTWTSVMGRIWVVVDSNVPIEAVSEADRLASKGRNYAYFLKPCDVYDLAYDDDGDLLWFLHGQKTRQDDNPLTSTGTVTDDFRLWTPEFTCVINVVTNQGSKVASVDLGSVNEHNLGIVPVFSSDHVSSDDLYKSLGLLEDVAYMDRAVANYLSNLDVIIQDQTYSQLAIPFQGMLPTESTGSDLLDDGQAELNSIQVMGVKRVFAYNAEGGSAPEFISPDVKQAQLIMQTITKIVGEIYHSIGMAGERTKQDNAAGIDNSSGVAKAYDFEKLNAMLAAKARALAQVERNLVRMVNAWAGNVQELEDTPIYVTYPTTFDVRNLADEMDNAQRMSVMMAPVELRRAQMKRMSLKMFPQAPAAEIAKIVDDIDNKWLADPVLDLGAAPQLGNVIVPSVGGGPGPSYPQNAVDNAKAVAAAAPPTSRVPGKKNSQGENNKGSVKAPDKAKAGK